MASDKAIASKASRRQGIREEFRAIGMAAGFKILAQARSQFHLNTLEALFIQLLATQLCHQKEHVRFIIVFIVLFPHLCAVGAKCAASCIMSPNFVVDAKFWLYKQGFSLSVFILRPLKTSDVHGRNSSQVSFVLYLV